MVAQWFFSPSLGLPPHDSLWPSLLISAKFKLRAGNASLTFRIRRPSLLNHCFPAKSQPWGRDEWGVDGLGRGKGGVGADLWGALEGALKPLGNYGDLRQS